MKNLEEPAREIVRRMLEDEEDYGDDDFKEVTELGQEDHWIQIEGDANPWIWGGSWYNPSRNQVIHFDGIDYEGTKEIEERDVEVPEQMLAKIMAKTHDPYLDTAEAKEDPEHHKWLSDREERERDQLIDAYKVARAEFLNARLARIFWLADVPDADDRIFARHDPEILAQFDEEMREHYKSWRPEQKICEIAGRIGWYEFGHEMKLSYREAQVVLGSKNI